MSVHAAHVPRSHVQILTNTGNDRMARITHQVHHHDLHDEQVNLPATPAAPQATAPTAADLFNDATTRMVGGIGPDQVDKIVADLTAVQQMLSAASPQINNLSDLHTHIIIEQLNEEIASVQGTTSATGTPILGTDLGQFVGRSINDIHRDIIDIAQAMPGSRRSSTRRRFRTWRPRPSRSTTTRSKRPFSLNSSRTVAISGRWRPRSRTMASRATSPGCCSRSRPSRPMPAPSTSPRAACIR